jgi:putative membrane protein
VDRNAQKFINIFSGVALFFLAWLIFFKTPEAVGSYPLWINNLNTVNAFLNFCSTLSLIAGFLFIKRKNEALHKKCMLVAFTFSALFLISYITYHHFHGDTKFAGPLTLKPYYFGLLISHILLSIMALPMVLTTFYWALSGNKEQHKKLARVTFPIWLYVSVTGVVIYFLLKIQS